LLDDVTGATDNRRSMGSFTRGGPFKDRTRCLQVIRDTIGRLKEGPLRGMQESWEGDAKVTLSGFGATVLFEIRGAEWACEATMPSWLPIPQSTIEKRFDEEFADLKNA
jgi:hypothetical protein